MQHSSAGFKLDKLGSVETPVGAIKNGFVVDVDAAAKAIRSLFSLMGIKSNCVFAAVSGVNLVTRLFDLPSMPRAEILEELKSEVENYAVLSGDEPIIDFSPLEENIQEGVSKMRVLTTAVSKELSRSYVAAVEKAKLKLQALDIVLLAIIRALDICSFSQPTMLVVVGVDNTTVIVIRSGLIRFLHTIDFSSESLNEEDNYAEIIPQIRLSSNYYQRKFPDEEAVEKVILCVDNPNYGKLQRKLEEELGVAAVEIADPFQKCQLDTVMEEDIERYSLPSIAAIGLAMRGIGDDDQIGVNNIDLLPPEKAIIARLKRQLLLFFLILFIEVLLFVPGNIWLKEKVESNQLLMSSIEREIEKPTSPLLIQAAEIEAETAQLESEFNKYATFIRAAEKTRWAENLTEIQTAIPVDTWLTNITWRREYLTIEGFSLS
ncbi:MAG: pilus assembly protein PilM, partial [Candidatus Poribacteria bacterium]